MRNRNGDIPRLADYFLLLYRDKMGRSELTLSPAALATLMRYAWPGNIRELENVIHNAVLLAAGPAIMPSDLRLAKTADSGGGAATLEEELRAVF